MAIEIEQNVDIPKTKKIGKYPWEKMHKGDSFAVEKAISVTAVNKRLAPKKFRCRPFEDGFRVWRIE